MNILRGIVMVASVGLCALVGYKNGQEAGDGLEMLIHNKQKKMKDKNEDEE